jgi:hypothetical protein
MRGTLDGPVKGSENQLGKPPSEKFPCTSSSTRNTDGEAKAISKPQPSTSPSHESAKRGTNSYDQETSMFSSNASMGTASTAALTYDSSVFGYSAPALLTGYPSAARTAGLGQVPMPETTPETLHMPPPLPMKPSPYASPIPPPYAPPLHPPPFRPLPESPKTMSGVPKSTLHALYGMAPRRKLISQDNYFTWHDGGAPHALSWTSIFICPLTAEVFPSGVYGSSKHYHIRPLDGTVWFSKKALAEHGAAARCVDCILFRETPPDRPKQYIGHSQPYMAIEAMRIPDCMPKHMRITAESMQKQIRG